MAFATFHTTLKNSFKCTENKNGHEKDVLPQAMKKSENTEMSSLFHVTVATVGFEISVYKFQRLNTHRKATATGGQTGS